MRSELIHQLEELTNLYEKDIYELKKKLEKA